MTFLVNIIGAGKLGKTIGYLLVKSQLVTIGAVCNSSPISTLDAIQFIGQGKYCPAIDELPYADITFITTPDDVIQASCEVLSKNPFIKKMGLVLHCSGSLTSEILNSIKEKECYIASVHPMRSFAKPELSVAQYEGTYCAIEGDPEAVIQVRYLFNAIGSITYEIDKLKKSSYHAAGVFASNYIVTLAEQALSCMQVAGVEHKMAMQIITHIMRGTVSNLEKTLSSVETLTGPIKRGDITTIIKHVAALTDKDQKNLYAILGKATLNLTEHDDLKKDKILHALAMEIQ